MCVCVYKTMYTDRVSMLAQARLNGPSPLRSLPRPLLLPREKHLLGNEKPHDGLCTASPTAASAGAAQAGPHRRLRFAFSREGGRLYHCERSRRTGEYMYACIYMYQYVYVCVCVCVCMYICIYKYVYIYIYIYAYICIYICIGIYIYIGIICIYIICI